LSDRFEEHSEQVTKAVRFLGVSGFFERGPATRERSSATLAEWVDKEMDRRLAKI
jgi:hypothetical protein